MKKFFLGIISIVTISIICLTYSSSFKHNEISLKGPLLLKESKQLVFLGNNNIAPIIYLENNVPQGVVVDITKKLAVKMGTAIDIEATDWADAQNRVLSGEADALLQINPNPERELLYDFSDVLLESKFTIFIKSDRTGIETMNDLRGRKVGVESGGYPIQILRRDAEIDVVIIPDWKTGFEMINSGAIDAVVVDRWVGEYVLAKNDINYIKIVEKPIETTYSRIAVKKGNVQLLNSINEGLRALNSDGTMARILSNWSGKKIIYFTKEFINQIILYTVIASLVIVLVIAIFIIIKIRKLSIKLKSDVKERTQELQKANEELEKANEKLRKLSSLDELTNVANRRYFNEFLQKEWKISKRQCQPLALIMADIDFFKLYNDTYGHLAGDKCLKDVAGIIKSILQRPGDLVARFGGEEFVVVLPNTPEEGAAIIAEKIRIGVENLKTSGEVVTVSLGVAAVIPNDDFSQDGLIAVADRALYLAKKEGRNQVKCESR